MELKQVLYLDHKHEPFYLSICECGYEECESTKVIGPIQRDYYILHFVISGEGSYIVNGNKYELKANDVFLINPGITISYSSNKNNPWTYYWIAFDSPKAKYLLNNIFKNEFVITLENINVIKKIFLDISKSNYKSKHAQFFIISKLYEILYYLFESTNAMDSLPNNDIVSGVVAYINEHIKDEINVDTLAKLFGFSRSRLFSLFKERMGISIKEYIQNTKLDKAYLLLENNKELSIKEVSWLVGYSNYQTFYKAFEKKFGHSPTYIKG